MPQPDQSRVNNKEPRGRDLFEEATIVDYLAAYQERAQPAPATYYRRFVLIRRFLRWVSRRDGVPDPFLDLEPPPKPRVERDWLEQDEFRRLLDAAGHPERNLPGFAERDRLALTALVTTGLRRSELCGLDWSDLDLDAAAPTLLVRRGKGGKPRRQPLPAGLAGELRALRTARAPSPKAPVFCGLAGGRLQQTILAEIIRRATKRAGLEKHVTAHTLRHTAATWLRQELGDTPSSPSTSATPTSQQSAATRTSPARNCSRQRAGLRIWRPETPRSREIPAALSCARRT